MSVPATKKLWQGIAISFAIVFAYATVLVKLFHDWWTDENYSHGLLIPLIIGYILWMQRESSPAYPSSRRLSGWGGGLSVAFSRSGPVSQALNSIPRGSR